MTDDERIFSQPMSEQRYSGGVLSGREETRISGAGDSFPGNGFFQNDVSGRDVPSAIGDSNYPSQPAPHFVCEDAPAEAWRQTKQRVLADFSDWLDELDRAPIDAADEEGADGEAPDLFSFYCELAALRRDAQLQAKTVQGLRGDISELGDSLLSRAKEQTQSMGDVAADLRAELPRIRRQAQADAVGVVIDLMEGLVRCGQHHAETRLPKMLLSKARRGRFFDAWHRPVEMLATKTRDALGRLGVRPVAAVGDVFDAGVMRVVEAVEAGNVPRGCVQEIIRQGYTLQGEILRIAEVKVVK